MSGRNIFECFADDGLESGRNHSDGHIETAITLRGDELYAFITKCSTEFAKDIIDNEDTEQLEEWAVECGCSVPEFKRRAIDARAFSYANGLRDRVINVVGWDLE